MFGYITLCEPEIKVKDLKKYKAYYCGLCSVLKEKYGHLGQMTLTYDMTFLIILLNSLYEKEISHAEHRCKVHPVKKQHMLTNEITEYAADMNIILSYYHLRDDWEDEKKISGLALGSIMQWEARKLIKKYPRQSKTIQKELKKLNSFERNNVNNMDAVAGCFGRLMEELFVYQQDEWEESLRKMGFFLGKFIYLMDAYEDLDQDIRSGSYNPLKVKKEDPAYEEEIREIMSMMMAESVAAFEMLPCVQDIDILRNILYMGVWNKYHKLQKESTSNEAGQIE